MIYPKLTFVTAALLASCAASVQAEDKTVPEVTRTQFAEVPTDIRNYRYCEIIPIFRTRLQITAEVYNTIGLNECPADLWDALDPEELKTSYDAMDIKMNGPRYWTINAIKGEGKTAEGKVVDFGGIEMVWAAEIVTRIGQGTVGGSVYQENEVQRFTTFTYSAGAEVYELTSPEGGVYRMQSYAQIVDPTLTIDDLSDIGPRLQLPEGWTFAVRVLDEDEFLIATGLAFVINDVLGNSYQRVNP
ncbi:hypothetical protein [Pseudooctadecabacter jejudonensis]|uniref:Uncharacterized protein n=1 Tax=Pseudooctadecabacter jejudonensis TaxID=1391910 RepID=A0A1Y5SS79_9RHOB|nr:hypothetical protein [Pseudooctadecabacter jejudonensis]SLN47278.1 hypothetical protein PSJ8397_02478 [Pseudooctadecabacter jejudonensis]